MKGPTRMRELLCVVMVAIVGGVGVVSGYPQGAPLSACTDMFPTGHHVDAKAIPAPFTLTVSTTTIAAGQTVTLYMNATGDNSYPYYEGVLVQARKANCSQQEPIGMFSIPQNDDFLKLLDCGGQTASAVTHYTSSHQTNKTFTWTVPDTYQGRIYFRATVVKNEKNFWTNVFSPYLNYADDTSADPSDYCTVRTTSSVSGLTASLTTAVLVTCFGLMWSF